MEFIWCWPTNYSWAWDCPRVWFVTLDWKQLNLPFPAGIYCNELLGWEIVSSSSQCWDFVWFERVHVLCVPSWSLGSYAYQSCCVWKTLLLWSHPRPLGLTIFTPLLLYSSLSIVGRGFIMTSYLGLRVPESFSAYRLVVDLSVNHHLLLEGASLLSVE